jgi:hypothetical protein
MTLPEGIHHGVSEAIYHADPCVAPSLSASIARTLLRQSPLHAWHAHPRLNTYPQDADASEASDAGTILHKILLGRGVDIVPIDAPDFRTKAAKEARDAARADGGVPILAHKLNTLHAAAVGARLQIDVHPEGRMLFEPGEPEVTLIWQEGDVWCRARPDFLLDDPRMPILDLKTTGMSAAPADWQRRLVSEYAIQCAFYRRGIAKLRGRTPPMRFIVIEQDPPFGVSVMCAAPALAAYADAEVKRAIRMWRECMQTQQWPGYPAFTAHVDAPQWLLNQQDERLLNEETAREIAA